MATIRERTNSKGETLYHVQVRLKGYPTQTATFRRLTDAKRWTQRVESDMREGRHFPGTAAKKHTVTDLIDRYRKTILPHKRYSTTRNQVKQLDWWQQRIGHLRLSDVTPAILSEVRDELLQKRLPATVTRYMAVLSHAFTIATKEWQWVEDSPFRRVSTPKEPRGRVRFLNDEERVRLLDACKASSSPHLHLIVLTALSTGARKGEILNLRWPDIDLNQGRITIHDTKNNERRSVPLAGPALDLMRRYAKVRRIDTGLVFPSSKGNTPVEIKRAWYTALRQAGIADFKFHDLRHSAASYLAMNGASLAEIAEVLGHRTLSMVKRYAHLSEQHTAGVVARMNAAIFGEG
jgi:integrase